MTDGSGIHPGSSLKSERAQILPEVSNQMVNYSCDNARTGVRNERSSSVLPNQPSDPCSVPLQPPYHGEAGANHSQTHSKHSSPFPLGMGNQSSNYPQLNAGQNSPLQLPPTMSKGQQQVLSHPQQSQSPIHPQYSQSQPLPSLQQQSIPHHQLQGHLQHDHDHQSRHHPSHQHMQSMGPGTSPFSNNISPMGNMGNSPSKQSLEPQLPHGDMTHASSASHISDAAHNVSALHHNVQFQPANHASQYPSSHEDVHLAGSRNMSGASSTDPHGRLQNSASSTVPPNVLSSSHWNNDCTTVDPTNRYSSIKAENLNPSMQVCKIYAT